MSDIPPKQDEIFDSEELLDELFPKLTQAETNCLNAFILKIITDRQIDPVSLGYAVAYLQSQLVNPIPTLVTLSEQTLNGVLTRVLIWVYIFIIFVAVVLLAILTANKAIPWQNALIYLVFIGITTLIMLIVTKHLVSNFVIRKKNEITSYLTDWEEGFRSAFGPALEKAVCIYTYPPDGIPPSSLLRTTQPCKVGCNEIKSDLLSMLGSK